MSTPLTVFKVLKKVKNKLYSAFILGDAQKRYKIGIIHKAPPWLAKEGYYLLAFDTLDGAKTFVNCQQTLSTDLVIYKALTTKIVPKTRARLFTEVLEKTQVTNRNIFFTLKRTYWPAGTVMCENLTLVERIQ